jgi:hypothetical protein
MTAAELRLVDARLEEYRELAVRAANGTAEPTNPWNRPEQKVEQPPAGVERLFDEDEG